MVLIHHRCLHCFHDLTTGFLYWHLTQRYRLDDQLSVGHTHAKYVIPTSHHSWDTAFGQKIVSHVGHSHTSCDNIFFFIFGPLKLSLHLCTFVLLVRIDDLDLHQNFWRFLYSRHISILKMQNSHGSCFYILFTWTKANA